MMMKPSALTAVVLSRNPNSDLESIVLPSAKESTTKHILKLPPNEDTTDSFVNAVIENLKRMADPNKNTAQQAVPQRAGLSKEVSIYLTSISIFFNSFKRGEITQKEMLEIEEKISADSGINPLSVYRIKDLIIGPNRANIVTGEKEVISNEISKVRKITKSE